MKFECENFGGGLSVAALLGRDEISSLAQVEAKDNRVTVTVTDHTNWVRLSYGASVSSPGSCLVSISDLSRCGSGHASVSDGEGKMNINMGGNFSLVSSSGSVADMPDIGDVLMDCDASVYHRVAPFADTSSHSERLLGVGFNGGNAIAGSGVAYAVTGAPDGRTNIVPASAMRLIGKQSRLLVGQRVWRAESDGLISCGLLIDAEFPDVLSQISDGAHMFRAEAGEMKVAIEKSTLGRADQVVIECSGPSASCSGDRFRGHAASTDVSFGCDGVKCVSVFSVKQVCKVLSHFGSDTVDFSCDGKAYKISAVGRDEFCLLGVIRDARNVLNLESEAA